MHVAPYSSQCPRLNTLQPGLAALASCAATLFSLTRHLTAAAHHTPSPPCTRAECPATGSLFSLKDGSIVSWYPNNPVLRALTPASLCRPLEIYPVHLGQDAISVDVSGSVAGASPTTRGGSDTSLENNNVYGLEPKTYVQGGAGVCEGRCCMHTQVQGGGAATVRPDGSPVCVCV
jgi:hypothetical protein